MDKNYYEILIKLYKTIEKIIEKSGISKEKIAKEVKRLSDIFNNFNNTHNYMDSKLSRIAYLAYFYPINVYKFIHIIDFYKDYFHDEDSYFDIGAGPLTFYSALCLLNKKGKKFYAFDKNNNILDFGKEILTELNPSFSQKLNFEIPKEKVNNIILGNVLIENNNEIEKILKNTVNLLSERNTIIIIEPGTKKGFENIKKSKNFLQNLLFEDITTCPATNCLMQKKDWCHENIIFPRSPLIQFIDNKTGLDNRFINFCYAIFSTSKSKSITFNENTFRVVSNLLERKGDFAIYLCGQNGINQYSLLKRHLNELNNKIKNLRRGDIIELTGYKKISENYYRLDETSKVKILKKFSSS